MEQNKEIDPCKCSQSLKKERRQFNGVKIVSSTNGSGTTEYPYAKKKKIIHRTYILHKNELRMEHRPKGKKQTYKTPSR